MAKRPRFRFRPAQPAAHAEQQAQRPHRKNFRLRGQARAARAIDANQVRKERDRLFTLFSLHGIHDLHDNGDHHIGSCPFCESEEHFYVRLDGEKAGCWDCKHCLASGNKYTFLKQWWTLCYSLTTAEHWKSLGRLRATNWHALRQAGFARQPDGVWLLPIFGGPERNLVSLKRWVMVDEKRALLCAPTLNLHAWGWDRLAPEGPVVLCEGEWDAIWLAHLLEQHSDEVSAQLGLTHPVSVLGIPSAGCVPPMLDERLRGREILIAYDNDQAGQKGSQRIAEALHGTAARITCLEWSTFDQQPIQRAADAIAIIAAHEGQDNLDEAVSTAIQHAHEVLVNFPQKAPGEAPEAPQGDAEGRNDGVVEEVEPQPRLSKTLPAGWDITDWIRSLYPMQVPKWLVPPPAFTLEMASLFHRACPYGGPDHGLFAAEDFTEFEPNDFDSLVECWERTGIHFRDDLRIALAVALAVPLSNQHPDRYDPVWIFLVGPPGSGKTMVIESLEGADGVIYQSQITRESLVSGMPGRGSLMDNLMGNCLALKEFTEVLSLPCSTQDELFGFFRGAFDGYFRRQFGNGVVREYPPAGSEHKTCHFSQIAGVTNAIYGINRADLGERYLKLGIADEGLDELATIRSAIRSGIPAEADAGPDMVDASLLSRMRRRHAVQYFMRQIRLANKNLPVINHVLEDKIIGLAQVVAYMRAHVDRASGGELVYEPVAEIGTRVARQLSKLAVCLCAVFQVGQPNTLIYRILLKVAMGTAKGWALKILLHLLRVDECSQGGLCTALNMSTGTVNRTLANMLELGSVSVYEGTEKRSKKGRKTRLYRISDQMYRWIDLSGMKAVVLDMATRNGLHIGMTELDRLREEEEFEQMMAALE